ncbi:hypothetical protein ISN45_Aa06g033520 [Arabidopsis thaliana x Arabidopsis arenosa]|uniref:Uncharacterized protein n=1 Tax=Arabidopsis thaliana x Arabidopsis arenosa TaxID=1240361 RepID=A0A8T1Z2X1_9BRAS|nr:hypothetical protein ISN45_Aa06g033520 [Arabidopsis thaliana x Arabidopsis arenosa]
MPPLASQLQSTSPLINKGNTQLFTSTGLAEGKSMTKRNKGTEEMINLAFGFGLLENIVEDDDGVSQFLLNFSGMAMSGNLTDEVPGGERSQSNDITCHEEEHKGFQIGGIELKGFAHGSV